MRNVLDTEKHREVLRSRNTDEFINATAHANYMTMMMAVAAGNPMLNTVHNCEYSALSATIIWLQERGCVIPADILATLKIEG